MKKLKKLLSLLLALLLGVLPCFAAGVAAPAASADAAFADGLLPDSELSQTAAQNGVSKPEPDPLVPEPDFSGLVTAAQDRIPGVTLLTEPIFYAGYIERFHGCYAQYRDALTGNMGVIDYSGNILFQFDDPAITIDFIYQSGFFSATSDKRSLLYTVNGTQITLDDYHLSVFPLWAEQSDLDTGEIYLNGQLLDPETYNPLGSFMVDVNGRIVRSESNLLTGPICNGTLACMQGGKWGLTSFDGTLLLPYVYDDLQYVDAETLIARQNGAWALIDRSGTTVCALPDCSEASTCAPYSDCVLVRENDLWGVRGADGTVLLPCRYQTLSMSVAGDNNPLSMRISLRGLAEDGWHYLSRDGAVDILLCGPEELELASECYAWPLTAQSFVLRRPSGYQIVDSKGMGLIPGNYQYFICCNDYLLLQRSEEKAPAYYVLYDPALNLVAELNGVKAALLTEKACCWLKDGTLHCLCLADGTEQQLAIDFFDLYTDRYIVVSRAGRYALLDANGTQVTDFCYTDRKDPCMDGLCFLQRDDHWYLLDCRGRELTPPLDAWIIFTTEGDSPYAAYQVDGKYGFLQYRGADDPMFVDVEAGRWFTEGIDFCALAGLMNGVGGGRFSPQSMTTRAMLVRVLYNLSGSPCASHGFVDVAEGRWYTDAINWAAACGIVNGVDSTHFDPDAPITREQLVTILYRYAAKFQDFEAADGAAEAFADADQISRYALEPMQWAVTHGLINGKTPTTLDPKGHATRAEIATVLTRFVKFMADCDALPALP